MRITRVIAGLLVLGTTTGCAALGCEADTEPDGESKKVVLATHDSWNMDERVLAAFEKETGYQLEVQGHGDAGQLTNKLVLSKERPIADVVYGIDNTFASRALENEVIADPGDEASDAAAREYALEGDDAGVLVPIDYGDVCVNVDDTWFAEKNLSAPTTLDDLTEPAYKDLFVTPGANTSSPGMAFLLTTIAKYGDQWPSYWEKLLANGAKVTSGWEDAYTVDFTAGSEKGTRPIVLSYSSSPPFTIPEGGDRPTTSALLDTCYRQVEYAGVLEGAANVEGAQALVEFMAGEQFQSALPDNMYVYPVSPEAQVPEAWARWAPTAKDPFEVDPGTVTKQRSAWLGTWRDLVTR